MLENGAGLQKDNVAVEFSSPIAYDGEDLVSKLKITFNLVNKNIPIRTKIVPLPSAIFDEGELKTKEAKEAGCDPDFNAWTLEVNKAPNLLRTNLRSCGAHVHVGRVQDDGNDFLDDPEGKILTIKTMDSIHGIISILLDNSPESSERRKLYGKAGCHRPTTYGIEYRVLSNFWLKSPKLVLLIDSLTQDALRLIREGKAGDLISSIGEDKIQTVINKSDEKSARAIVENTIIENLCDESKSLLKECLENISKYEFEEEWGK
jgi:hypothetical protein